jgi:hypothetical protein
MYYKYRIGCQGGSRRIGSSVGFNGSFLVLARSDINFGLSTPLKRAEHKTVDYLNEKQMQAVLYAVDVNSRTGTESFIIYDESSSPQHG